MFCLLYVEEAARSGLCRLAKDYPSRGPAYHGSITCRRCFPEGDEEALVPICYPCRAAFDRGRVPDACMGSTTLIGCEYKYLEELRDITPLEEKLISLNTAYGFITKFNI